MTPPMHFLTGLDVSIYRALNDWCGWSPTLDRVAIHLHPMLGPLFLGMFGLFWFRQDNSQLSRRQLLIMVVPAVAIALILNRTISTLLPFRARPMYSIGAHSPSHHWVFDLENWSSFPSDTATFLFAITACLWAVSRPAGALFGIFSACVALSRVYFGLHYPSDILVGGLIGYAIGYAMTRPAVLPSVSRPLLAYEARVPGYFYGLLFMVLAEFLTFFWTTRAVAHAIVFMFTGYGKT